MEASNTQEAKNHALRQKWAGALDYAGFQAIPNLLRTRRHSLILSSTDSGILPSAKFPMLSSSAE